MGAPKSNSPLLGYNTNVRHSDHLFHIQTEDSGIEHPHVITHLFTAGTILATKKTPYDELLAGDDWEDSVRQLMKDQHKSMFLELREGKHDGIASQILGKPIGHGGEAPTADKAPTAASEPDEAPTEADERRPEHVDHTPVVVDEGGVRVIRPGGTDAIPAAAADPTPTPPPTSGTSIFATPDSHGEFGEDLITDKSLDEVILSYLQDDLDD